jgi:hypothetical protein
MPGYGRRSGPFNRGSDLAILSLFGNTSTMDPGEILYISSRLLLGALASFFAIMLWSKTRDIPWMLMVTGTIAAYVETVYSILDLFGLTGFTTVTIGSVPLMSIVLHNLPVIFYTIAFIVMVVRKYRKQ